MIEISFKTYDSRIKREASTSASSVSSYQTSIATTRTELSNTGDPRIKREPTRGEQNRSFEPPSCIPRRIPQLGLKIYNLIKLDLTPRCQDLKF